jgi:LysM repeat protein
MAAKQISRKIRILLLLGLVFTLILSGCATVDKYLQQINEKLPSWAKSSESKAAYHYHKVRYPGESLSVIAEWYTGDVENWPYLAKANSKLDPDHITIGSTVLIPKNLLHTNKPMPNEFVEAVAKRHKAEKAQIAKAPPKPAYYYHRVKYSGETLSIIAKWYTGDVDNWQALTKANPKLDPKRINVGDKIRIPKKILNTRKPMPRSFVVASTKKKQQRAPSNTPLEVKTTKTAKKESESPPAESSPKEPEVLELFGPK